MPARTGLFALRLAILLAAGTTVAVAASDRGSAAARDAARLSIAAAEPWSRSLGITAEPLDHGWWTWLGLPFGITGAVITSIADNGPAARAGVGIGDIAIAIDDLPVDRASRIEALRNHHGPVRLALLRHGATKTIAIG